MRFQKLFVFFLYTLWLPSVSGQFTFSSTEYSEYFHPDTIQIGYNNAGSLAIQQMELYTYNGVDSVATHLTKQKAGADFEDFISATFKYSAANRLDSMPFKARQPVAGEPWSVFGREIYQYHTTGTLSLWAEQYKNGNSWHNERLISHTVDPLGRVTEVLAQTGLNNTQLTNYAKRVLVYDSLNRVETQEYIGTFFGGSGNWAPLHQTKSFYHGSNNLPDSIYRYDWGGTNYHLVHDYKTIFEVTALADSVQIIETEWSGPQFGGGPRNRHTRIYNKDGILMDDLYEEKTSQSWLFKKRMVYAFDQFGRYKEQVLWRTLNAFDTKFIYSYKTSAVAEPKDAPIVSIFPNPTHGAFEVQMADKHQLISMSAWDARGHLIAKSVTGSQGLDLTAYPSGVYNIQIILKDGTSLYKRLMKE
jgi:Secretion system C-terminal sorting domain